MAHTSSLTQNFHPVSALLPAADAAGRTATYISLKNYHKVFIEVHINQGNAATVALTPYQATSVAAGSEKVLTNAVTIYANQDTVTSDALAAQTAAVNFTTSAAVKGKIVIFEIDPASLDVANGFDCITVKTGASNAANITQAMYYGPNRYPGLTPPTSLTD